MIITWLIITQSSFIPDHIYYLRMVTITDFLYRFIYGNEWTCYIFFQKLKNVCCGYSYKIQYCENLWVMKMFINTFWLFHYSHQKYVGIVWSCCKPICGCAKYNFPWENTSLRVCLPTTWKVFFEFNCRAKTHSDGKLPSFNKTRSQMNSLIHIFVSKIYIPNIFQCQ